MGRLDGKVALVTGASRGTGAATARLFAEEGARVVLADVSDAGGEALARELGADARYVHLDVSQEDDWARGVGSALAAFGGLDVLVNNAALLHLAALEDTTVEACERLFRVNQLGAFLGMRSVVAPMRAAGRGSIVNVSSIDGLAGKNGVAAYAATKWAVRGLTKVAAVELGRWGIRVNAVCPEAGSAEMLRPYLPDGVDPELVLARQQPLLATQKGRSITERVRDVARLIAFLASDEAASCTGADFAVDGGNTAGRVVRGAPGA
jgi:3alpha(or 20beta)-hydroxysteroid dehydrogenase